MATCIEAEDVPFAIVYAISNNPRQFWDLGHAKELLGWTPKDSAPSGGRMKTIVCYGDSNTYGADPATGNGTLADVRWTGVLAG